MSPSVTYHIGHYLLQPCRVPTNVCVLSSKVAQPLALTMLVHIIVYWMWQIKTFHGLMVCVAGPGCHQQQAQVLQGKLLGFR